MSTLRFQQYYKDMYSYIGRPLQSKHALTRGVLREHEARLGIKAPEAIIAYYRVAGNERHFNLCLDELLPPKNWYIDQKHFVFYEAHQAVVIYGIRFEDLDQPNPPVQIGYTPRPYSWGRISPSVTEFIHIMTYWQGVYAGALTNVEWAIVKPSLRKRLDSDWELVGELNKMWCYRRPGQVVCYVQWGKEWRIYAGGDTSEDCARIGKELKVKWQSGGVSDYRDSAQK